MGETVHLVLPLAIVVAWLRKNASDPLLDGGPVLTSTGVLWVALFAGPYVTATLQQVLRAGTVPPVVVQLPTLAILYFAWRVYGAAQPTERSPE